ncbi:Os07g0589400, partial [Oryza sativa Japonica Group]
CVAASATRRRRRGPRHLLGSPPAPSSRRSPSPGALLLPSHTLASDPESISPSRRRLGLDSRLLEEFAPSPAADLHPSRERRCGVPAASASGREREERVTMVSMEVTDEMFKCMEVGLAFRDYNGRISSMDFHSKATNYLVTACDDESIRLYDIQNAVCLKTINSKKYGVELVCFTENPTYVLHSSKNGWDDSLRLLSLVNNCFLRYFKGHLDRVVSISLCSENGNILSGSLDRTVLLWDSRVEKAQGLLRVQGRPAVSYDDQGLVFAIAYGGYIRMFDARNFEKGPFDIFSVGNDDSEANVIKFSSDGRRLLLTTKAGRVHVLDSFHGNNIATYNVKPVVSNSTLEASFSPDGNHIISGSGDGSVYAWNVRSGKVARWGSTDSEPPLIRWAPGSLMFLTASSELSCWVPDLSKLGSFTVSK